MKLQAALCVLVLSWMPSLASAQTTPARSAPAKPAPAVSQKLPPFSGTWLLNMQRSKIEGERPNGKSRAVIQYDGKTWHYIHIKWNGYDQQEDAWQVTLVVGSPVFHVEKEEPLT